MILLLTGCINPDGMSYTSLSDPKERKLQYTNAIKFYLTKTSYPIVFSENSGTDISYLFEDCIKSGRMEYLSFSGNRHKERGKGYGECEIIEHALKNSRLIHQSKSQYIVKITGRLIIRNIHQIIRWHRCLFSNSRVFCSINSNLSFPDSRLIVAPVDFYQTFLKSKDYINDSNCYYFEHALCDTIKNVKTYPYSPFFIMPRIEGQSGSTGVTYTNESKSWSFAIKYARYALSQFHRFYKLYR